MTHFNNRGGFDMSRYMIKAREPISSMSHCIGAVFFALATVLLILKTLIWSEWSVKVLVGVILFGCSLVALYSASSIYHFFNGSQKTLLVLRKLDHAMIYVLIAGTYTPILLKYLAGLEGWVFTIAMWACAIIGIVIKLCWFSAPRWLQTVLYIAMGWAILFDISIFQSMSGMAVLLLALGGISYTAGGVIYILKKPNISAQFGFHELFHMFVLAGSLFHFFMIFFYVA
jgi:hemolysin III